jgi:hypothetical protein
MRAADAFITIGHGRIHNAQLPPQIVTKGGVALFRPPYWSYPGPTDFDQRSDYYGRAGTLPTVTRLTTCSRNSSAAGSSGRSADQVR